MKPVSINVGPLLTTLAVVFTIYFGGALAIPAMPAGVQEAIASLPPCLASLKGTRNEDSRVGAGVGVARVTRNG